MGDDRSLFKKLRGNLGVCCRVCAVVSLALLLVHCGPGENSASHERQCTAFNHPEAGNWVMGSLGAQTVYSDQNGRTATFTLTDVKTDPERIELVTPGGGDTLDDCRNTSKYLYASQDRGYEFTMEFEQWVYRPGDPVELQKLEVLVRTVNPNDRSLSSFYYFQLDRLTPQPISGNFVSRYDVTRSIDNVTYVDVLEADWTHAAGPLHGANAPAEANWLRVVIARNIGLVQFETADGRVFTRSQ